jgi:hypothetical protein
MLKKYRISGKRIEVWYELVGRRVRRGPSMFWYFKERGIAEKLRDNLIVQKWVLARVATVTVYVGSTTPTRGNLVEKQRGVGLCSLELLWTKSLKNVGGLDKRDLVFFPPSIRSVVWERAVKYARKTRAPKKKLARTVQNPVLVRI